jgi:hypothetical protein
MDQRQSLPVPMDFLFIPIAQKRLSENDGGDTGFVYFNAFNPVGRYGALNKSMFPQYLEALRGLPGK